MDGTSRWCWQHRRHIDAVGGTRALPRTSVTGRATGPAGEILVHVTATPPAGRDLLAGKVVVITAAAGTGIGSATARPRPGGGARVAVRAPAPAPPAPTDHQRPHAHPRPLAAA